MSVLSAEQRLQAASNLTVSGHQECAGTKLLEDNICHVRQEEEEGASLTGEQEQQFSPAPCQAAEQYLVGGYL